MRNPYKEYQDHTVAGKNPLELMLMLYDGAIGFLRKARACVLENEATDPSDHLARSQRVQETHENLVKAKKIVVYLISSLDTKKLPENAVDTANNLMQLYMFCYERIGAANLKKDAKEIEGPLAVFEKLREGWKDLGTSTVWKPEDAGPVFEKNTLVIAEA